MRDPNFGWIPVEAKLPGADMDGEDFLTLFYYDDAYDIWAEDPREPVILIGENNAVVETVSVWHEGHWYSCRDYEFCKDERDSSVFQAMWWQPIIWPALPREEEILRELERLRNPEGKRAKIVDLNLMGWTPTSKERPGIFGEEALVLAYSEDSYEDRAGIARPLVKLGEKGVLEGKVAIWCPDNQWHTDKPETKENLIENVLWYRPIVWPAPPAEPILYKRAERVAKLMAMDEEERKYKAEEAKKEAKKEAEKEKSGWESRNV